MQAIDLLWLIPALPLAGAAVNGALAYRQAPTAAPPVATRGIPAGKAAGTPVALGAPPRPPPVSAARLWPYLARGPHPPPVQPLRYPLAARTRGGLHLQAAVRL